MSGYESELEKGQAGIFAALPNDPFGDGAAEEPTGTQEDQAPDTGANEDHISDEEAADALSADEDEEVYDHEDDEGGAADEDEDEDDEAEDEADEDDDGEEEETPELFTIKVNGEDVEVTLQELRDGYSRTASWTQKSQKLSEERKAHEVASEEVKRMGAEYAERLQALETQMRANLPEEPSPQDPQAWIRYQQEQQKLQAVAQERFALQQRMQHEALVERQKLVDAQNEILRKDFPEWKDEAVETQAKKSLATFAVGVLGFEESDIEGIVDARVVKLLAAAKELHDLNEAKEKVGTKKRKAKKTLKPGQRSTKSGAAKKAAKRKASSRDNLRQSGGMKDAESAIHDLLGDDDF